MLVNRLTANDEYSRRNMGNLPPPVQMHLYKKTNILLNFFAFLEATLNFEHFEIK